MDFEYIKPLLADASIGGDGEYTDAERRADVMSQFRDKFGRWVEMGRGIKGKVRLGKGRGADAGRTARIVGKFINATPDGKFARVLVDPSDPNFGGKIVHIRNDNAEEILATLDPEYLKKRGIQLGRNTEGFEVGDEGIQDEDTLTIEDPTPQDLEDSRADLPDPGDYKQEASTLTQGAVAGRDLATGNIVYDQGSDQYGKVTQVRTLADGTKQIFIQFQNGRRAIMNVAADHQITAWVGAKEEGQQVPTTGPSPKEENSVAALGIDLQTATMDANGARLPTPGAFTGAFQRILNKAKDWADIFKRLWNQTVTYFDLETNGISNYDGDGITNSPIQLGAVKVKNGKIIGRFNVYMNPGSKLSEWSADNLKRDVVDENGNVVLDENGKPQSTLVTPEWLAEQMSPTEAIKLFLEFIGPNALLGGQNVPFDLEILQRMADEAGVKLDIAGTIDSKDLASLLPTYDPEKGIDGPKQLADKDTGRMRPSSSLGPVANFLGFEPANWHSADGDAEDSYNLVREIISRAAKENNPDMRLLDFPEMQRLYKERMAAFKNSISPNNPITQKQLEALNELAGSDNSVVAEEAKKAINEATTRGKAAEVLARLDETISRPNNNTGPSPKQERGGPDLPDNVLGVLARLDRRIGLKEKKVKKRKNYIPMGYDRMSGWDQYPQEFREIFDSAADLDQFVKMFWDLRKPGEPIDETMYAIAAAMHRSMSAIDNGRGVLTYRGIRIEFDSKDDFDGKLLEELKGYLDTMKQFGFKLPTTIIFGKAGALTFDKRKLGFNPETGTVTWGESDIDEHGGLRLIMWDQVHNLEGDDDMRQFVGTDPKTGEDIYLPLPGEPRRISLLLSTMSHEIGHLFNREKHGKITGSPVWAGLKKMFWGSDSAPFKRFNVVPKSSDVNFDERMADLFMAAFIGLHNRERVLPNVAHFWKIAIEPFIDAEPLHWTANAERLNAKTKAKAKPKSIKETAKNPKDILVGDVLYDKDGNLHGKVVRVSQDKNGNWHYWVHGKDFKPGDQFPDGLDEYFVHKDGIVYLSKNGVHFVPDNGPDLIDNVPDKLDSSNSDGLKVEDIKPGMVYDSPDGPANVVNVIKHGDPKARKAATTERLVVYVDPKTGELRHEVVPVGTFKKVLTSSKTNVNEPGGGGRRPTTPGNENQGGEGNGNGNDRGGEGNGGGGGGRGGNTSEPVSEEPEEPKDDQNDPGLQKLKEFIKRAIDMGMRVHPDEDWKVRSQFISDKVDRVIEEIKKLGIKDYAALADYLEENDVFSISGDPWSDLKGYVREFLDPGYGKRQRDALDSIKELLKERIEVESPLGEKTDVRGGLIDDILRPYLDDKAGLNYEELLDLLDKNLKPGEIKHVEKREGFSLRGNWEEVVKAVQDIINSNLGKQQSTTSAKPTEQKEYLDANGKLIKVGDLVDVFDEYGQKKTIRIYKKTTGGDVYVGGKRRHPASVEEGYVIEGGDIVNVLTGKRYRISDSVLSPENGSQKDIKSREKIKNDMLAPLKEMMFQGFIKKHREENPNMDTEVVRKLAERDVATALEELKKLGVLDYDIFNGELDDFTDRMFWIKTKNGDITGVRQFNSVEDVVAAAKEYIDNRNAQPEEQPTETPESESESDEAINNRISELLKIAKDHLAKGEYKEAYEAYIKASNLYEYGVEDSSEEVETSEEEQAELEKIRENKAELEKKAEEGDEDAALDLWDLATQDDDREAQEKWARKLSEIHPYSLVYAGFLADALVELGRLDEAESIYRDIIEKEKELLGTVDEDGDEYIETEAKNDLAQLLASKGLYEEAARLLAEDFEEWGEEEESTETPEPEITTDDPIGRGKIDPKGYGTNEGYVRMTHPTPDFPAETNEKNLIEKGFEIEDQDNQTGPSPKEEEPEEGEEGVLPPEDPSKFAVGKKTTIIWHNKDFSSPGARIKITYTRKADGSLDESYTEIQWVNWDGSIGGDGYGPGEVYDFELGRDEKETFRIAFEFATKALAKRNKEYNNNELPGQFPHPFKKVGNDHIWRVVKDAKTGKLKAGRDTKRDMEKKPPFGAVISHKDGKWTATVLDAKGNTVATFEVDGDANDQSALENIMNQAYAELAKKYREINSPRPTPAARPTTTPATTPAGKATDEHNFPLPDDVEMFKIRNGRLTEYGINLKVDVDIFGETSASIRDGLRFGAVIGYIESKGHWYVGLRDANSSLDRERGIKDLSVPETYKTIKGDINDPKAWEEAVKEARKFVSDAIARHGGKNIRYGYEHRSIKSLDDVRVNDYIIFRTSYPPSVNLSDTDRPEEYISSIIGKVLSIGKDKEGNRTFKIQGKDGKIKNLTDKKLDYVGGAVRFSDDDPTIEVSTLEIVKKRVAKREMKELRYSIRMHIDKDPNKSEDSLEKIYKAVEDKIGPDLSEDHIFVQSLQKALSKKMYDKSNTKGYLTEEEIYEIADKAIEKYSTGKKSTTETKDGSEGITGEHNHPLPEDVQMFPAGVGEPYAKYVINGEGFQHEADYPDVRAKDGLRYGAEIYYEEAIEPNSYNKKGRLAGWRISLLNNAWREDMSRRRLIDYRNAEVPGDINDPEVWKKAVEEARRMVANAIAENGGNNNPYTSEYIALESLDQLQAGDYLMNDAFFPPTIRNEGTKSEEVSPQFYAKIAAVGKDKDGNRIFEVERTAVKDSKPYITVFTDEEFKNQFGIGGGIARYSDENPDVKPTAESAAEPTVEEEPKELTEEELQANRDAWSKVGQLYREYIAAKRGTNKKREAKRLKQELSPYPVVMLHEKLTDYRDILDNTRKSSTDENERKALTKRSAEITDAMKQLNILVNKGVKEGAGKPTDPLEFNFDNLFRNIELEDGISESDVEEAVETPEVVEEPVVETTEEPAKNIIETSGGVLDFEGLSPMQLGKINKHLDSRVVWEGESMTYRELYKRFAIGKRKFQVRKDTDYVDGKPTYTWGPIEYRLFIDENRGMIKVPKMIYDAFKPTSDDPSLNEDRTAEIIEAEWAKKEAEEATTTTTTTTPAVSTTPVKPTTPSGFGPQKLTSETAKKYPAMDVDKDWTIYGPDGYALGVVTKKETVGSVTKLTVKGLDGKETIYSFQNLVKIPSLSPKDKKDIEKAEKAKAKVEEAKEEIKAESKDSSATKVVKKEINDAYSVNLKLSVDEKLELWKSLRDRGLITVKNIMDVVPGDYVLAMRNLDYPKPFNWDKWGAKGYYEQEFRKVVSIENEPQRGKLRPILDDGWVSHSSNPAKADVLVLTPDAFESEDTTPESETSDKISREDGFRLFEAIKKVYDFIHKMDRTEDPDAAKKDANDKVNQLAKILNPEDVDDFIRYVDAINKYAAPIMFNKDYLKNFSDYLDKYTPGQGVAKNPIHRSMDGREIKDGDILNVIDKYGDVRQIRFGIIRKRSNRPLTDKADTYELGYAIEVEENGSAWIVNINNSREVYEVSRSSHAGPIAVPTTPAQPEVVEEAKPAAETEYNKDLENDLAVFRNALEDIVENFRNQPGADKDVYKAATKEIYNELKKLNSLYNNSENSGEDLEKIREVYDQKMRDIGDIQAAKAKDLGPSPKEEVFAQSAADLQNAIIQEAIQLGDIEDKYGSNLRDTLFRVVNSYSMGEALKKATAKRIFRYMSDVKFDDLLKVITTNVAPNDLFNAGQTLDISYSRMLSPTEWFFDAKPIQKDPVWIYNAFNADLSNLKDGTELLVNPINNAMVDGLSIFTIDTNLINAVKNSKGTGYGPADSIDSKDILDYMRDKFELRVFSSYNQDDVDYLKTGMIGYLVKSWAISSNDNNLKMHAMQNLASEIFAMDNKATAGWNFINNKNESYVSNMRNDGRIPEGINTLDDLQDYMDQRIVAEANEHREVYTQFIHAMYNSTQDALKEAGIDGMILYRGTDGAEMKDNDKLPLIFSLFGLGYQDLTRPEFKDFINELQEGYVYHRPMSAWSTNFEIANTFSGRYGSDVPLIAGVKIPAERIFAFPGSGFGCYNEAEVVVLGGELTPVTYIVSKTLSLSKKNEFLETVKTKFGPKTILTMEKENGDFVEFLDDGPSPKEERPILNIDNSNDNADWIKQVSWDLPTDMSEFLNMFSTREQLSYFMTQPVAVGMPEEMSRSLWPAADEHFKKIDELPKPEEPKYLTEPFDPQDPNLDLEAFYNFDYSKNPDGSPFTRSQAGEMGYAELAVIREIHNGNEEDIKNAKRHRLDTYLKVTAKPDPKSTTTVESVDDQIEGDFDLDSPVEEYRSPYNPAIGLKRYVNYFTDKYGRRYVLLTDTSQNNTGNLYVTAYDTTGKTPEQVQEDFIDSKNYSTPDLHIAFLGAANAAPDYSDKNYESKRYVDLVTTSLEYRRRGLAAALLNVARKYSTEPILHSDTLSNAGFVFSNSVDRDPRDHINEKSIAWQEENSTSGPSPKEETPVSNFLPEPFDPRDKKIDLDDYYGYDYTKMPDGTPFNSDQKQQMDAVSRRIDQVLKANNGDTTAFAVKNLKNFRRTQYQQIIAKPTEGSSTTRDSILEQVEFSDKPSVKYFDEASRKQYTRYVDKFTDKYGRKYYIVTNIDERSGRQTVIAYDERNFEGMPLPEDYVRKDQPVSGITDVGGLDSYIYKDPSQSEIQSVMVNVAYQRRGIATALVAVLEKRLGLPVVHSDNLSSMGFAFSNSMDPGKPELHTNEESIQMQSETGPSPKEEKPSKKLRKEPFDPTDFTFDLEKFYNFDYSKMPDGRPFDVYRQQQMDILQDAIDNAPDSIERNLRINERRRIYQGYTAKPNLKSSTNLETIKNQVRLLDDNTSRMNYSGAGKPYADLSPEYKQSTQYIDEFTDKYGRQYWVVTKVVNGLGMSNVKLYDKSKNSLQDLQDNSEDILPVSMLDVFNNKISMVYTSDRYVRRGLATAALHLARERSGKEVQHSEMLTVFGRAFSISVDPNPVLHRNDESKALLLGNKTGPSPKQEIPEDDGGDEIDTNRTPGNILAAQLKVLADGLGKDFSENADYKDISVDPENLPESLDIWKNLQFMAPMSQDLKIVAAELISAEMRSSAKNILRSLSLLDSEELMDISDEVRSLLGENEDESDDYDIFMRAFETDINNLNIDSLILSYDAEDVLMYVSTMREFIDSDDEDRSDSYFTPERLLKQLNKYIKDVRDSEMQVLSSAGADIQESMRYVGSVLFIKQWAQSANDEILADVLQKAAVEAFNMKDGSWATSTSSLENEPDEKLKEVMRKTNANYKEKLDYLYDMNSQVYVDFIKGMYKVTQAYLKDLGIEYVRVYRGTGVTEAKDIQGDSDFKSSGVGMVDVLQRPMSSWSFDEETALGFAANVIDNDFRDPMFLATLVPAGQVLGFPGTGFGCFEEGELVLLGGFPRKVMAAVHKNNSQEKKSTGNWLTDSVVSTDPVSERDFFLRKALPQINEHFTNLSELDTQDLLNRNSGTSDSTGPSPKEERTNSDKNLVSLQQAYMEENDPELEVYEDSQTTFPRIGIGSDNRVIGYVKPRVLRSMKGNYTERTPNYRIDAKGGLYEPIRVSYDPENGLAVVVEGNHRVKAALDTKREYVPVFVVVERGIPTDSSEWEEGFSPKKLENVDKSKIPDDFKNLATAHPIYIFDKSDVLTPPEQTTPLNIDDTSKNSDWIKNTGPSPKEEKPVGGFPPEPFNPNDRTLDLDTIYNYDYTKLPDGTPFDAKQQKAMDHENKLLEDAIASGDDSKIRAAKIARRYTYSTFTTVANPDSKTNTETIADQITPGKAKPKKFTGFVRYTDNFIDKYGRKYVIFTDISTDDSTDNAVIVTAHDLESQFLTTLYTPEGMENVDRFGGKYLHIASLKVDDSDRKDLNGTSEIGIVGTDDAYRRRGLATALLYLARKHYKKPVNHSSTLTRFGRAFSNSVDAGKPDLHDSLESKQLQIDLLRKKGLPVEEPELDGDEIDYGPSPKEEKPLNVDNSIENSDWVISEFAKKKKLDAKENELPEGSNQANLAEELGISNDSKPSQNREGSKEQIIASAAKDIASSGIGFTPGTLKLKGNIATDGPDISISGSPKDRAKAPSDQATALKNEMISLGHTVLDDAIALSDEQAKAEGLIPEGYTAEEYRKKLENDVRAVEVGILRGDSKFRSMSQDLMRNAFNRLSYEDKEEIFQSLRQEALRGQGGALSGKDINVFSAEETFNMLLVEYGDDLAYKLSYDYATTYPEFLFDTGKTVLMRQRAEFTGRLTKKVEEEKTLVDVTWAHEGPDTILTMLTKWAIQSGKIDMSEFTKKAAEIKDFRDRLNSLPKAKDFTDKYHSIIGKNIKSQLENAGVEFDSVKVQDFFKQYKNYKLINTNDHFQDVRWDNNRKLIKNLEDTLSLIPKDIILAGMDYLKETGGMLGVQVSDARAHFVQHWLHGRQIVNMIRKNGQQSDGGYFRGDSTDDYLHEVWHFFQMINPDISTMEHAFTYDRVKEANSPDIFPIMELYETSVEKSFSGAKVVNPYTVKQYKRMTSKMSSFSPLNHSAEVITTTMQDLFTSPGRFSTPNGVTVKTGTGKKTTRFSDAHMDIATGIWYTDATMTTKIDPALITGIEGLDVSNDTDWDLKAFGIGLLLSLLNWENK